MNNRTESIDRYLAEFAAFEQAHGAAAPEWLRRMRQTAIGAFAEQGFPTTKHEEWKYTNVAPLLKTKFDIASQIGKKSPAPSSVLFGEQPWNNVVCVNGRVESVDINIPEGVRCESLASAFQTNGTALEAIQWHLGRYAKSENNAFTALNTAFLEDGVFIFIPDGCVVNEPIHIAHVSASANGGAFIHPRTVIALGKNSKAAIIETFSANTPDAYFMNAVTEIVLEEGATLAHTKLELESVNAYHIATTSVAQKARSNYECTSVMAGGALTRNYHGVTFDGTDAQCRLDGLYIARGNQHIDNHTMIDHRVPRCASREFYKGVLQDNAHAVFNGKVFVREDAQKTDARQTNKNLLLSDNALVDTKPQLEIYADDVKCTHGATVGQLDENAIYYLRTRGIAPATARQILTAGFASEIIETIAQPVVSNYMKDMIVGMFSADGEKNNA